MSGIPTTKRQSEKHVESTKLTENKLNQNVYKDLLQKNVKFVLLVCTAVLCAMEIGYSLKIGFLDASTYIVNFSYNLI